MKEKSMENTLNNTTEGAKKMKSPYEIAWNFLNDLSKDKITSSKIRNLVDITGLEVNEINLLSEKVEIVSFLSSVGWLSTTTGRRLSLVKQVIEEIEQGKPHWEIGESK